MPVDSPTAIPLQRVAIGDPPGDPVWPCTAEGCGGINASNSVHS